jgi:hypothetical protein
MQAQAKDLARLHRLVDERENQCSELVSRVARGDANMAELALAQEQLRELQVLEAAIRDKASRSLSNSVGMSSEGPLPPLGRM